METTVKFFSPDVPVVGLSGAIPSNDVSEEAMFIPDELPPYIFRGADLNKLDADLKLIKLGQLDVQLPEDTYDYDAHQWETPKGKLIGEIFALIDAADGANVEF